MAIQQAMQSGETAQWFEQRSGIPSEIGPSVLLPDISGVGVGGLHAANLGVCGE